MKRQIIEIIDLTICGCSLALGVNALLGHWTGQAVAVAAFMALARACIGARI